MIRSERFRFTAPAGYGACWQCVSQTTDATLSAQLMGISAIFLWTFVVGGIAWMIIKMVMGLRISEEEEIAGSDIAEIGIEAYPEFTR